MEQNIYESGDKLKCFLDIEEDDYKKHMVSFTDKTMDFSVKEKVSFKKVTPRKGEIWTCDLGQNVGSELNKTRPVIISSNNIGNAKAPFITIVPISSKGGFLPTQVTLNKDDFSSLEGGNDSIKGSSQAEQIRVVSKFRLGRKIGELNKNAMTKVELSILASLGML